MFGAHEGASARNRTKHVGIVKRLDIPDPIAFLEKADDPVLADL